MSWDPYLEDLRDEEPSFTRLLPSFLKDVWSDDSSPNAKRRPQPITHFYSVQFHVNHRETVASILRFHSGEFVVTDADRGVGIGQIVSEVDAPPVNDVKVIVRLATAEEIAEIPGKQERERRALMLCQAKVRELGLPMEVTGAEFQFDGKKLTFYYSAGRYVDFRDLVKSLFRVFGTRIWMVWHDGGAPVKDVYSRGTSRRLRQSGRELYR
jgi:hypothetical protein